ncbi:MAG: cytochrome P460 family protein [bacterium]
MIASRALLGLFAICSTLAIPQRAAAPTGHDVGYPEGYRRWVHVRTGLSRTGGKEVTGMHHIYANDAAMKGYIAGKFPQGSVIVFDLIGLPTVDGTMNVGTRSVVDVMQKDSVRFAATGGWGYDEFRGDTRERTGAISSCAKCHFNRSDHDYVFSAFTDTL